jgi:MBG domain (YGX type)
VLSNYSITYNTASFTITPKSATWTTNANSKLYGASDPNPLTTGSGSGFLVADNVTATYSRAAGELPGTYHITATLSPVIVLSNYTITNNGADFSIGYGTCTGGNPGGVILPPINQDGSSVWKVGSTVPVKFTVCGANGQPISDPTAVFASGYGSITLINTVRGTVNGVNETTYNDIPDSAFRWSSGIWIFNMATGNLDKNATYSYRIALKNGSFVYFTAGTK